MRYHLVIIILLLMSNLFMLSVVVTLEKKNSELEQQLSKAYESSQYSDDLLYSLR